ncbi:MAG: SIS domain-containing protein [Acidimicrobiales bacterium]|nr:SIS domain-containing protein [Acidimicrobiales bacterium]
MCGIIALLRHPSDRTPPSAAELTTALDGLADRLRHLDPAGDDTAAVLVGVAEHLEGVDRLLRGTPGVTALLGDGGLRSAIASTCASLGGAVAEIEAVLDAGPVALGESEAVNAALIRLKDALWAIERDRLRAAAGVVDLAGPDLGPAAIAGYLSIHQALSAIDRLEVRGRDSAGLHLLVSGHGLAADDPMVLEALSGRGDALFTSGSVRCPDGHLSIVYKAAAEIGELGDNTAALRADIRDDALLRRALAAPGARVVVLGHTRWASVGIISQPNAHPLNAEELDGRDGPYLTAALNGDVDNFADLKAHDGLRIAGEITTDAKVIPTLTSRAMAGGSAPVDAFRSTVNRLEGSVAIAASAAAAPDDLLLALRGSGQALYIGLAEDLFIVASEPYGVVEETDTYLRMDGETPADAANPAATRGQVVRLRPDGAGTTAGIDRWAYDGTPLPVGADELATAQITTRDIDRGDAPHFLLKEITEAPASFRKTLRGRLVDVDGALTVRLGPDALPDEVVRGLRDGTLRRIVVTGQGTAAIAAQGTAALIQAVIGAQAPLHAEAMLANELSGFGLREDMSNTLVVAISQSGTTTDTNRTVDLVRARGAKVVSIVNRRNSDLTDRSDGVLYTADGRDVEMAVASTKAFYSQIAAGMLLAVAVADTVGGADELDRSEVLHALRELPDQMARTLDLRAEIADAAHRFAPSRRYWAIVGNGVNRIAAHEIRIKLSELCYKSIASDSTEDKKHIDLSSEPLILVCAAGLTGSTADDVAKEVAIFRAHKAAPIVIASEGEERFSGALAGIFVPPTHPLLAFVLSAMVGHLFGYEAALAIDAQALPLREARAAIEAAVADDASADAEAVLTGLAASLQPLAARFFDGLRSGEYDGHLEASSAVRLASTLRYGLGVAPLETYQLEYGKVGTPSVVIEDLTDALTRAIEELTRPVDAIKHQAKTVTVGISRSDETLLQAPLVREVLTAGASRDRLSYQSLRTLAVLDALVDEVLGYTRYRIEGRVSDTAESDATIAVVDRGGIGRELRSRTEDNPALRGTKHRVAIERLPLVASGRADGRTVLIVPEVKDNQCTGLTLLHVSLRDSLPLPALVTVLEGYRGRLQALRDAVTETEPAFREDVLGQIPIVELMTATISQLAERWRA